VIVACVRLFVLDRIYAADVRERRGPTVVVGWMAEDGILLGRLKELRGYAQVRALQSADRRGNGYDAEPELLRVLEEAEPAPRQVFLEVNSLGHKATLDLIQVARDRGCEVYIAGRLVSALDSTGVLFRLFEPPVMRVYGSPAADGSISRTKRWFDVVASAGALVVLAPVFAAIAIAVKLDSRGPVFFRQERIGLFGRPFRILKFRSMTVRNDDSAYREHMLERIRGGSAGEAEAVDEFGRPQLKLGGDTRVTHVGRFLRRFSLDELPQFWNVLRGDMSMVGPRPALDYEAAAYTPFQQRRLEIMPGVSGLWQVSGRSRVAFDEMVLQDVIYSYNDNLLTDVSLCLRTVPAMLSGRGAL
jgi:lipopolysaccharide/colanic/teichoic acid biosynthesis glycosyltransferase